MSDYFQNGAASNGAIQPPTPSANHEMEQIFRTFNPLTGTSIKILLLMLISNRPSGIQQLVQVTGISRKTIKRSMGQLAYSGAVYKDAGGCWRLSQSWRAFISISILQGQIAEIEQLVDQGAAVVAQPAEKDPTLVPRLASHGREPVRQIEGLTQNGKQSRVEIDQAVLQLDKPVPRHNKDTLDATGIALDGDEAVPQADKTVRHLETETWNGTRSTVGGVENVLQVDLCALQEDSNFRQVDKSIEGAYKTVLQEDNNFQKADKPTERVAKNSRQAEISVQRADKTAQPGDKTVRQADTTVQISADLAGNQGDHNQTTVVVKDISSKKNKYKYMQQQQTMPLNQTKLREGIVHGEVVKSHGSAKDHPDQAMRDEKETKQSIPGKVVGLAKPGKSRQRKSEGAAQAATGEERQERPGKPGKDGHPGAVATGRSQAENELTRAERAARRDRKKILARYLKRAGILGPAFSELVARQDLLLDPRPVLAWWWYALAQEQIRSPAALAIRCLQRHDPPPAGFLDLVTLWPRITREHREHIEEMVQRNWSAEELVRTWQRKYPEITSRAFIAMKELYLEQPEALGY